MPNAVLLSAPPIAPLLVAVAVAVFGWRRSTAIAGVVASAALVVDGGLLAARVNSGHVLLGHVLRADSLAAVMVIVIGAVATLALWASIGYLDGESAAGHTNAGRSRQYGVLCNAFVGAMAMAVLANNLGVMWVAIEATTVMTAFLVGHRRTRRSLEATWKYVIICSVGISLAFLGTVLLYFASLHAGSHAGALDIDGLAARAAALDPGVTRLAAVLLLLGYGTKVGLAPFHSWLADAHSEAPAPVSALMSGVLLAVAFSALLRLKVVLDAALGPAFLRGGLLTLGLLTLLIAASMLVVQRDYKRMLAYSSLEQMGLVAVAAAAGTKLAIAALLLHVLAHGLGKSVLFIGAGHLQLTHQSTAISDVSGVVSRSRLLGGCLIGGLVALVGFPPFALFASEIAIARGAADAHLAWALGVAAILVVVASAALLRHGSAMLLGTAASDAPALSLRPATAAPMLVGLAACAIIGVSAAPLTHLLNVAGAMLAVSK
jgi:hydrogenase-4 component F